MADDYSKYVFFIFFLVVMCVVSFQLGCLFNGNDNKFPDQAISIKAYLNKVPSNYLIGIDEEDLAIVNSYIEGRIDVKSGKEPVSYFIPESTYYGYCHGYADNSDMNYSTVFNLSKENAMRIYG